MSQPEHIKPILERVIESMLSQFDEPQQSDTVKVVFAMPKKQGGYNKINIPSIDGDSLTLLIPPN